MNPIILCGILKLKIKNFCHFISKNPVKYNIIRIKKKFIVFLPNEILLHRAFSFLPCTHTYVHTLTHVIYFYFAKTN